MQQVDLQPVITACVVVPILVLGYEFARVTLASNTKCASVVRIPPRLLREKHLVELVIVVSPAGHGISDGIEQ